MRPLDLPRHRPARADRVLRVLAPPRLQHGLVDLAGLGVQMVLRRHLVESDHELLPRAAREEVLAILLDRPREVAVV